MMRTYVAKDIGQEEAIRMAWELVERGFHILSIEHCMLDWSVERCPGYKITVDTEGVRSTRLPPIQELI